MFSKKQIKCILICMDCMPCQETEVSKSKFLGNRILEKNIANVVQFSSSRDWTIFPTDGAYYSKQQESFKGELLFLQVSLDGVVSIEAQNKLFYNFKKAKKQKVIIEGANHNFS